MSARWNRKDLLGLRELSAVLEKVKQAEEADAEVSRLEQELKALPADPDAAVRQLQGEQERLALLAQHIAHLERLRARGGRLFICCWPSSLPDASLPSASLPEATRSFSSSRMRSITSAAPAR